MKHLDEFTLDWIPVQLGLDDHQEGHPRGPVSDGGVEVVRTIGANDLLVDGDHEVVHLRPRRAQQLSRDDRGGGCGASSRSVRPAGERRIHAAFHPYNCPARTESPHVPALWQ
ncbi:hypothetical protein [Embleya hyalina]|uniref:hypothetical protein n=1 Tax=Embleya hyalina TaxID=516124 RepID=UPI000F81D53D|nr:hypothetical protein [Embleya hyalina]